MMDFASYHKKIGCTTVIGMFTLRYWVGTRGWTASITSASGTSPLGKMWIDERLNIHYEGGITEFPEAEIFLRGLEATWRSH